MASLIRTILYCFDPHRSFSDDITRRFSDSARYEVKIFHSAKEMSLAFVDEKDKRACRIAIIGVSDPKEANGADELVTDLKNTVNDTGIIIIVNPGAHEEIAKLIKFNIDAWVPLNANTVLRVHNAVKKHISEYNIVFFLKKRNISAYALISLIVLFILLLIFSWFRFPIYF